MSAFQTQQLFTNQYNSNNRDDENDDSACSSKENYVPVNYYSELTSNNTNSVNDYNSVSNGLYTNTPIQSTEQYPYSSMFSLFFNRKSLFLFVLFADMYNPYYQSFATNPMADYDNGTRYNTSYGLISYDSSYLTYPSTPLMSASATNFNYVNDHYQTNQ